MSLPLFAPAPLLGNRHVQTIWPAAVRRPRPVASTSEVWVTEDGDVLDVELLPERAGAPVVLVIHGLEGSARSPYVRGMLAALDDRGWSGLALNFRSCGPTPPRGTRLYHSGDTRDFPFVVSEIRARFPGVPVFAVGFSMGGNALLKWLGEAGGGCPLDAAVVVSVPFDLGICATSLDGPGFWPAVYRARFLRSLRRKALRIAACTDGVDAAAIRGARTFAAFDEAFTAKVNGYDGAEDYWAHASSGPFVPRVRRPTLVIHAEDDPFVPVHAIPRDEMADNPAITAYVTPRGGHVGFVTGTALRPRYLVDELALAFLMGHVRLRAV